MHLIIITIINFSYSNQKFIDEGVRILIINHQSIYFYFIGLFLDHLLVILN